VIVLDTTVLVYAVGEDHPLAAPGARLIEAISVASRRARRLGAFDAVLAAATTRRANRGLVSADRAFRSVPGLMVHDPGAPAFLERLGVA